jgi:hypothetical protein
MNREEKILKALDLMIEHTQKMACIYLEIDNETMYDYYGERRQTLENFKRIITNDSKLDEYIEGEE